MYPMQFLQCTPDLKTDFSTMEVCFLVDSCTHTCTHSWVKQKVDLSYGWTEKMFGIVWIVALDCFSKLVFEAYSMVWLCFSLLCNNCYNLPQHVLQYPNTVWKCNKGKPCIWHQFMWYSPEVWIAFCIVNNVGALYKSTLAQKKLIEFWSKKCYIRSPQYHEA